MKLNYRTAAMRVCVDQAGDGCLSGHVVSQRLTAPLPFSDVNDLVVKLDVLMDIQKFPQAFQRVRSFSAGSPPSVPAASRPEEMLDEDIVAHAQGQAGTFLLYVSTRHDSTWQGFVDWLDGTERQPFSSTLELLKLAGRRFLPENA